MSEQTIQQKVKELELIMFQYKNELGILDRELFQVTSDYQKTLSEERVKEIRESLKKHERKN